MKKIFLDLLPKDAHHTKAAIYHFHRNSDIAKYNDLLTTVDIRDRFHYWEFV
jgi:hypothetical protein